MNILMLGRWLPPPRQPVQAMREYQVAVQLARTHRLTLAFIADNPDSAGSISALRREFGDLEFATVPRGWKSVASAVRLVSGESCTLSYFRSNALSARLVDRLRRTRYSVAFVSSSTMIQYALELDPAIPMVMDFGGVGSEWWLQQAARRSFPSARFFRTEAARLRAAEAAAARRAVLLLTETEEAARIVESLGPASRPVVLPSGVDVESVPTTRPSGKRPTVIFNTPLNGEAEVEDAVHVCGAIVRAVRTQVPQACVVLAGAGTSNGSRMAVVLQGAEVVSSTPALRRLFHDQAVVVAPLRGGFNDRSGVLEAMAAGVPVVTTSRVRDELRAVEGHDLAVADTPAEFAREVIDLLESGSRREEIGANGRCFVQAKLSWPVFGSRLEALLLTAAGKMRPGAEAGPEARPLPATLGG